MNNNIEEIIINLREENKELGRYYTRVNNEYLELNKRINKSIKYIKSLEEDCIDYNGEVIIGEIGTHCKEKLLNILNGGE